MNPRKLFLAAALLLASCKSAPRASARLEPWQDGTDPASPDARWDAADSIGRAAARLDPKADAWSAGPRQEILIFSSRLCDQATVDAAVLAQGAALRKLGFLRLECGPHR